jgi:hypothetical protein
VTSAFFCLKKLNWHCGDKIVKFWGQKGSVTLRKIALKLEKKHQTFETAKLKKKILVVTRAIFQPRLT